MRLTKKQIERMRELYNQGKGTTELAKIFKVTLPTVYYWISEKERENKIQYQIKKFRNLTLEQRRKTYKKRKEYIKAYKRKRYAEDEEYRKKELERQKKLRYGIS